VTPSPSNDPYAGAFFTPSGGPVWHWRALWRQYHWTHFKSELSRHLEAWQPPTKQLLLLGPSAGWCLPSAFLTRFETVDAVDIDPLAPTLFRLNHGMAMARSKTRLTFHRQNLISSFETLLSDYPQHAIFFANMLGQHRFHDEDEARAQSTVEQFKEKLSHRHWASFHDRLSGYYLPGKKIPKATTRPHALNSAELASELGLSGQWLDHLTANALPSGTERHLMYWPLLKDWLHIVEFGSVEPE
jgi:hypothetical protein